MLGIIHLPGSYMPLLLLVLRCSQNVNAIFFDHLLHNRRKLLLLQGVLN